MVAVFYGEVLSFREVQPHSYCLRVYDFILASAGTLERMSMFSLTTALVADCMVPEKMRSPFKTQQHFKYDIGVYSRECAASHTPHNQPFPCPGTHFGL
jgi:hypothetical protein